GCSSLTNIEIPNSVTSIGDLVFCGCSSLTNIEIPSSVTVIGEGAFYYCPTLTNIEIPSSVTSIGNSAFYNCEKLTSVYCHIAEPLVIDEYTFKGDYAATLYVPEGTKEAYSNAPYWQNFANIVDNLPNDGAGIDDISADGYAVKAVAGGIEVEAPADAKVRVINISGVTVSETTAPGRIDLPAGIYIVTIDGTSIVRKVAVK
ncbi:MAG: leucine-rich repeat domain-containing protein, partial [Duncaniella sp.]|nr:leucine-rich repeat domain-containing protein [Duncaniella sp.]